MRRAVSWPPALPAPPTMSRSACKVYNSYLPQLSATCWARSRRPRGICPSRSPDCLATAKTAPWCHSWTTSSRDLLPKHRYRCANDVVCGWAGALGGAQGIAVVAGTGSIAYGEYAGRSARAGGWGELFSDEGSAFWLAREALASFSRMSDGRAPEGPLYELVREYFGVAEDLDVCAKVYGPPALSRSELAALAPLVTQAVHAGDASAREIFESAGRELAALVHAVRDALGVAPDGPLAHLILRWADAAGRPPIAHASPGAAHERTELRFCGRHACGLPWGPPSLPPGSRRLRSIRRPCSVSKK